MRDGIDVTTPAMVGALEMRPEIVVEGPVEAAEFVEGVVEGVVEASVVVIVDAAVDAWVAAVPVIVLRFGRSLGVDWASIVAPKSRAGRSSVHREDKRGEVMLMRRAKRWKSSRRGTVYSRLRM